MKNADNIRFLHSVIVHNLLYFSNPGEFNDPFEMNPALYKPKVFKKVTRKRKFEISPEAQKEALRKIWGQQQEKLKKHGVCCFSKSLDDIVMWSHYADNHQGVCLIFDTSYNFFNGIQEVNYIPKRLQMPVFEKKNTPRLLEIMVTKLDLWRYEKEWRLFRRYHNRNYKYPKSALKGIVFGCRSTEEDKDLVVRLSNGHKLKYYEARMSEYDYKISIVEIQP